MTAATIDPSTIVEGSRTALPVDRRIAAWLADAAPVDDVGAHLRAMLAARLDDLPLPGRGATLVRWRALAAVARHDLSLVKLFESHTDALAIAAEIDDGPRAPPTTSYAVWAAEAPDDPLTVVESGTAGPDGTRSVRLRGRKSWCSGAGIVDRALMTARDDAGARHLVEVALGAAGLSIDRSRWQAVGMRDSGSFDVLCDDVAARRVGGVGAYLARPGFWHGGGGIAACWFGAAAAIGTRVRDLQAGRDDPHALAHLGAIDGLLATAAALLREVAAAIDDAPARDAMRPVVRVRSVVADTCERVIGHAARALGPGPLCNDRALARLVADLPIFVRQSRAEHDLAAGSRLLLTDAVECASPGWPL